MLKSEGNTLPNMCIYIYMYNEYMYDTDMEN